MRGTARGEDAESSGAHSRFRGRVDYLQTYATTVYTDLAALPGRYERLFSRARQGPVFSILCPGPHFVEKRARAERAPRV